MPPVIVDHPNTIRGPIEETHNALRDAREKEYVAAKVALEEDYHADLATIQANKEAALLAAGLNADGGVPTTYPLPLNTTAPTITGTAETGQTLTCNPGNWAGDDSLAYQWVRDGTAIGGATASTRVLVLADEGTELLCRVTATNEHGSSSKDTAPVTPEAAA